MAVFPGVVERFQFPHRTQIVATYADVDTNDATTVTEPLDVCEFSLVGLHFASSTGSHTTRTIRLQAGNDKVNWWNIGGFSTAAGGQLVVEDIHYGCRWVRAQCNNAEGAASTMNVILTAKT